MAITTLDGYIAAPKQLLTISRNAGVTAVAVNRTSNYHVAGSPGAGALLGSNTANGVLVTSSTAGFPSINNTGLPKYYLTRVNTNSTIAASVYIQDLLYKAGTYPVTTTTTLSAQPSIASRVPNGTDFTGVAIYFECVTAYNGIPVVTVTYTNQSGVTGRTTGAFSLGVAPILGKVVAFPLQSGDTGVQKIESVTATGAVSGTFNILLARDLHSSRIPLANMSILDGLDRTGMAEVFQTSAINVVLQPDGASTGSPGVFIEISSG